MAKSFDAYKIVSTNGDRTLAFVWWDGKTIRANSENFLSSLKDENILGYDFVDGKKFFDAIPHRYSNGYLQCFKTKVDQEGNPV
jgi:hypothetical protein